MPETDITPEKADGVDVFVARCLEALQNKNVSPDELATLMARLWRATGLGRTEVRLVVQEHFRLGSYASLKAEPRQLLLLSQFLGINPPLARPKQPH